MFASHRVAPFALVSALLLAALPAETMANPQTSKPAAAKPGKAAPTKVTTDTRVYLLRGLLNVFSLGMDALQERLSLMGFDAEVDNHNGWLTIANKIVDDRKKGHNGAVVLIGHSLGADVLFQLTERLEKDNVPVRLVVFFDPTISHDISRNVEHALNLYQLNGFGRKVTAPKGYKGELVNMDLSGDASIGHGSIDKSEKLHDLVIAKIMKVAVGPGQRKRSVPSKPKPVTATPPGTAATLPAATPSPATAGPSPDPKAPLASPAPAPATPTATPPAQVPRI
jgi:thioesterase domain-containing protein